MIGSGRRMASVNSLKCTRDWLTATGRRIMEGHCFLRLALEAATPGCFALAPSIRRCLDTASVAHHGSSQIRLGDPGGR